MDEYEFWLEHKKYTDIGKGDIVEYASWCTDRDKVYDLVKRGNQENMNKLRLRIQERLTSIVTEENKLRYTELLRMINLWLERCAIT